MIVEFVGLPGAGKTTLAEELDRLDPRPGAPFLAFEEYQALKIEMGEIAIQSDQSACAAQDWPSLSPC